MNIELTEQQVRIMGVAAGKAFAERFFDELRRDNRQAGTMMPLEWAITLFARILAVNLAREMEKVQKEGAR